MTDGTYGTTRGGIPITDVLIDGWVAEAEAGYEPEQLRRGRGRPPFGGTAATVTVPTRVEPTLYADLAARAEHDHVSVSEEVRIALRRHLYGDAA